MADTVAFEVPGVPVGKGRPRFSRRTGVAFTPTKTRSFEAEIKHFAVAAMAGRPLIEGPVALRVVAYMPIPASWSKKRRAAAVDGRLRPCGRPDADNLAKIAGDSLNQVVFRDDAQVVSLSTIKAYSERPRLSVRVEAL